MRMLMLVALSLGLPLLQAWGEDKPTCAVLPFKAMGSISPGLAEILSERVFFEIAKSGRYQMIERTQVERTLKENQISAIASDTAGIEAGRLLGSKFVIIGSVGQLGRLTTMNSRIVSVATGEIVAQAANDHEGRVEGMLRVAEISALQLMGLTVSGAPGATPARTAPPPAAPPAAALPPLTGGPMLEGQPVSLDLGEGVRLDLVWIAPGQFTMGAGGRSPGQSVTLTRGFWMGRCEVSNRQYQRFVTASGYNGARDSGRHHLCHIAKQLPYAGDTYPVIWVSWINAASFCAWMTTQAQSTGQLAATGKVRLPTDAEWEYACRAGTRTSYYTGDQAADLSRAGWWSENCGRGGPKPSGQKEPNAWGLYDMHGNAAEWVEDWWDRNYYPRMPTTDPAGPACGRHRTLRGGAWTFRHDICPSGFRLHFEPTVAEACTGFRVAVSLN